MTDEKEVLNQLGFSKEQLVEQPPLGVCRMHPVIATGLGLAILVNLGILLSLPPVLRGKGAPYLPTFQKNMNAMFEQLRNDPGFLTMLRDPSMKLRFVDLGSGDGRVVFQAAREGIFHDCVGYEINPMLHAFAAIKRVLLGPQIWSRTHFFLGDLWKVDLRQSHVVAVYGLGPIMKDLGIKLKKELPVGSYVLSNVFSIPGWKPLNSSAVGTYIYKVPDCWQPNRISK